MTKVKDLPNNPAAEAKFRQGFTHGVEAALLAVEDRLSDDDKMKLARWKSKLLSWRTQGDFEAPEAPAL